VSTYEVYFKIPGSANSTGQPQTVFVEYDNTTEPQGGFTFGWIDPATSSDCGQLFTPIDPPNPLSGTVAPDGTITMNLDFSSQLTFGTCATTGGSNMTIDPAQWTTGLHIMNIKGITYQRAGGIITGAKVTKAQTTGDGAYTTIGNAAGCNTLVPLAVLTGTPLSGPTSTNFAFDGTGSFEPTGACGVIDSYSINFADGSPVVTNSTGSFSHTFSSPGDYPVRLTVHDTVGHVSTNVAQVVIAVTSSQIQPSGIVSRKIHGTAGTFDVVFPGTGMAIEPRAAGNTGGNGDYELVFVFPNTLASVASVSASATGATQPASVSGSINPSDTHQYLVRLTGVPNAQRITVTLNNALDTAGASGNVPATFGLLIGDTNADGFVNSADIGQTKAQSGHTVTSSNFREDVNADGFLNSADIGLVKSKSGTALP
jgi:hypothetical protein